jgi:hypothetical protein
VFSLFWKEIITLNEEIMRKVENGTANLRHGIVRFALHIVDGKPVRYTISCEQSVMWAKDEYQFIDHLDNEIELERVEK